MPTDARRIPETGLCTNTFNRPGLLTTLREMLALSPSKGVNQMSYVLSREAYWIKSQDTKQLKSFNV